MTSPDAHAATKAAAATPAALAQSHDGAALRAAANTLAEALKDPAIRALFDDLGALGEALSLEQTYARLDHRAAQSTLVADGLERNAQDLGASAAAQRRRFDQAFTDGPAARQHFDRAVARDGASRAISRLAARPQDFGPLRGRSVLGLQLPGRRRALEHVQHLVNGARSLDHRAQALRRGAYLDDASGPYGRQPPSQSFREALTAPLEHGAQTLRASATQARSEAALAREALSGRPAMRDLTRRVEQHLRRAGPPPVRSAASHAGRRLAPRVSSDAPVQGAAAAGTGTLAVVTSALQAARSLAAAGASLVRPDAGGHSLLKNLPSSAKNAVITAVSIKAPPIGIALKALDAARKTGIEAMARGIE